MKKKTLMHKKQRMLGHINFLKLWFKSLDWKYQTWKNDETQSLPNLALNDELSYLSRERERHTHN